MAAARAITLFVGPFMALFLAVIVTPLAYAVYLSLFSEKSSGLGFGGAETVFVGIANYVDTLKDQAFTDGFLIILGYCVLYIPLMIGGALGLALLLDSGLAWLKRFFQLALFMPHIVPGVIAGLIWLYLYLPGISPIVDFLGGADFLTGGNALGAVVNIALWEWVGYNMIIYFAALQAIPAEVLEAARMDGAGRIRTAFSVKLPLIRGAVVTTVLFTIIGSLQAVHRAHRAGQLQRRHRQHLDAEHVRLQRGVRQQRLRPGGGRVDHPRRARRRPLLRRHQVG